MTESQNTALALLRCALWGGPMPPVTDMAEVRQELSDQAVLTLTADVLGRTGDREAIREAANRLTHFYAMMAEQSKMLSLLAENGIPAVVLKGAAAALYYPKPEYRRLGDVDLLIDPAHFDRAMEVIRGAGYGQYLDKERHMGFSAGLTRFEVHRHFSPNGGTALDDLLFDAMSRRQEATLAGFTFPMLPPLENGVVLLAHLAQHLQGSAGLRQFVDWMLWCAAYLTDEYYETVFAPTIRPLGLETLAITATRLCQRYLGLPGERKWCQSGEDDLCEAILEQVFSRGIFGIKDKQSASAASVLNMAKNPIKFLSKLQTMGCATWQAVKKYPFLKCFAWLYQICRLIRRGLARKHPFARLRADKTAADTQYALLRRLGLE